MKGMAVTSVCVASALDVDNVGCCQGLCLNRRCDLLGLHFEVVLKDVKARFHCRNHEENSDTRLFSHYELCFCL